MNVIVMGAGGLGGYFGGLLAVAGHDVTFIARGAHLAAIRRQEGLRVRTVHGDFFARANAVDTPQRSSADLVLFTVKSFDTASAIDLITPAVGPETLILSLQNGVDNEEQLAEAFGSPRTLGGVVYMLATIESPGVVIQTGGPRKLMFGEWTGGMTDRVRGWETRMQAAGMLATGSEDIQREKWVKFAFICAQAGMTALTRLPIGEVRSAPPTWTMYRQILEEVVAVGRTRGVRLGSDVVEAHLALAQGLEPHITSSLHYDLTNGKRLEIEALHGTVVRYGQEAEVPTPASSAVYAALLPHDLKAQRSLRA